MMRDSKTVAFQTQLEFILTVSVPNDDDSDIYARIIVAPTVTDFKIGEGFKFTFTMLYMLNGKDYGVKVNTRDYIPLRERVGSMFLDSGDLEVIGVEPEIKEYVEGTGIQYALNDF